MCAAAIAKNPVNGPAPDEPGNGDITTIWYSGCYTLFALAKEGLSPKQKWLPPMRIVVKDLGSDMIRLLIDIAYHIPLLELVTQHNIGEVLDLTEMLQVRLSHLLNHCVNFLKRDNQPESCIDNYYLVSSRGYNHLANEAFRYLLRNFDQVWKNSTQFEALTPEEMRAILEDSRMHSLTRNSLPVGEVTGIDLSHKMWLTPRIPKHILLVFGGWTDGATNVMSTYNYRAAKWRVIGNQYTSPRSYHGVVVINQCIYVVGGFNGRECYHSVVCYEGHIYAMGGYDGTWRIKTAERYDVKKNNWTEIANMHETRSDASAATACGRVYIMGGYTGLSVLDSVEFYDPSTNIWTQVPPMPWRRSGHKLLAYKDIIYIIGGFNGVARVSTLQQFDPQKINTSSCPTFPTPKATSPQQSWKALYIYVIRGFNGTTTVSLVERYDIESRKWFMVPEMPTRMSACSAAVIEDVANPGTTTVSLVERYDIESRKWFIVPEMPTRISACSAAVIEDVTNPAAVAAAV
nr:kelch-like protein 10 [Rhipicephalus microplus]